MIPNLQEVVPWYLHETYTQKEVNSVIRGYQGSAIEYAYEERGN